MTTSNKTKPKQNLFEEEVTPTYQIEMAPRRRSLFEIDMEVVTEDEQYMLETFHTQAVAVTGRAALAQFTTDHIGEMASHASSVMTQLMEQVTHYEAAAQVGRFAKPLEHFNNRLLDDTSRAIYEINWRTVQQMDKDSRTAIYREKQPPAPPKRKGALRGFKEFLLGEE
jgi:hypothetical protein